MRKLVVFNQVTVDGYFSGMNGDLGWAHQANKDAEFDAFVEENAKAEGVLVFGRITYELMRSYWPTPDALKKDPVVAERMNSLPKVDLVAEIRKMKDDAGEDMAIMGSGTIVSQLAPEGLIDEYQIVTIPVALGKGRTMFDGIQEKLTLKLTKTRTFANGNAFMCYEPIS